MSKTRDTCKILSLWNFAMPSNWQKITAFSHALQHADFEANPAKVGICFPARTMHFGIMEGSLKRFALGVCVLTTCYGSFGQNQSQSASASAPVTSAAATRSPLQGALDNDHRIQPGDKLSYKVDEDREEAKVLTVADSGEIELPFNLGRVVAANRTCQSLAQDVKSALERDYYHRATVRISVESRNTVRGKVYVSGEVSKPGAVPIPSDVPLKLSEAILQAGPPTQWAKLKDVKVVRRLGKKTETKIINVEEIMRGRLEDDIALQPDDFVVVPTRGVVF